MCIWKLSNITFSGIFFRCWFTRGDREVNWATPYAISSTFPSTYHHHPPSTSFSHFHSQPCLLIQRSNAKCQTKYRKKASTLARKWDHMDNAMMLMEVFGTWSFIWGTSRQHLVLRVSDKLFYRWLLCILPYKKKMIRKSLWEPSHTHTWSCARTSGLMRKSKNLILKEIFFFRVHVFGHQQGNRFSYK